MFSRSFVELMDQINQLQQDLLPNGTDFSEPPRVYVPGSSRRTNKISEPSETIAAKTIINHLNNTFASNMARQRRQSEKAPNSRTIAAKFAA